MRHKHQWGVTNIRDWSEVLDRIVAQIGVERGVGRVAEMHDQQVVPVGRLAGDLRRSDRAAGPGQVLDDELSAEILAQSLRGDARDHVTWAARRIGHHHRHRPTAGIVLRPCRDGQKPDRSRDHIANFKQAFPPTSLLLLNGVRCQTRPCHRTRETERGHGPQA